MLLNTVSLDYTNKFTSWSPLNYCCMCRSALGPEDSPNRIKTRWGNKQLKNGSVKGSWMKPSSRKAQNQQCHSIVCAVPFWPGSTGRERSLLVHSSSDTEQGWSQAWLFPKDTFCVLEAAQLKASPSDFESQLGSVLHQAWEWDPAAERNTNLNLLQQLRRVHVSGQHWNLSQSLWKEKPKRISHWQQSPCA